MSSPETVLADWVGAHYPRVFRTAVMICGNPADAEEAVQEAFVRAWRFRDALPTDGRRDAWLYRVLVNACPSKLRREIPRRERERERVDEELTATAESPPERRHAVPCRAACAEHNRNGHDDRPPRQRGSGAPAKRAGSTVM